MHDRYENLVENDLRWLAQGMGVQVGESHVQTGVDFPHPGDDVGRVAAVAFRRFGASEAGEVLRSFKRGYDPVLIAAGYEAASDEEFIQGCRMAMSVELQPPEIAPIAEYLRQRASAGPLTEKVDQDLRGV